MYITIIKYCKLDYLFTQLDTTRDEMVSNEMVSNEMVSNEMVSNERVSNEMVSNERVKSPFIGPRGFSSFPYWLTKALVLLLSLLSLHLLMVFICKQLVNHIGYHSVPILYPIVHIMYLYCIYTVTYCTDSVPILYLYCTFHIL